jgi:hypothetical protein
MIKRISFAIALLGTTALAGAAMADPIKTVFVIAMENENFIQPANQFTASNEQIFQNPNAPFINSLIGGTATNVLVGGTPTNISAQTAFAGNKHNVLANAAGTNHIHPSEPNYMWQEGGSNFGVLNDNEPFGAGGTEKNTANHLTGQMQAQGVTWKSYQEGIDLARNGSNQLTNTVLPQNQWTVSISSFSGTSPDYTNPYNGSHQFNYAAKHNPMVFFTDTSGGNDATPANPQAAHYAPLEQLQSDLNNNTVAQYNWITPDQFNDMHNALSGTFQGLTNTNDKRIKQGDNFLAQIVPIIMASDAYKNDGAIVLWWDETESDGAAGDNADDLTHFLTEIVISPDVKPNVNGLPYESQVFMTHSSDLRTMQEIFDVTALGDNIWFGDAANATDLSDLFLADAIPELPEPSAAPFLLFGLTALGFASRRRKG